MARPRRRVVLVFTPEQWDRLAARAAAEERDPWQQARWLVLRGLEGTQSRTASELGSLEVAPDRPADDVPPADESALEVA